MSTDHEKTILENISFATLVSAIESVTDEIEDQLKVPPSKCKVAKLRVVMHTLSEHLKKEVAKAKGLREPLRPSTLEAISNVIDLAEIRELRSKK